MALGMGLAPIGAMLIRYYLAEPLYKFLDRKLPESRFKRVLLYRRKD